VPATRIEPLVGWSIPARRLSSVDLPEPDGPISARKSPSSTDIDTPSRTDFQFVAFSLPDVLELDQHV
jgi:hypothetical protein